MRSWRISPSQERWLMLATRFREYRSAAPFVAGIGGWRSVRLISRCLFFVLGGVAAATTVRIADHLDVPSLVIPGVLLVAAAEWLIVVRRLVFAGVEESLLCAGLLTIALAILMDHSPGDAGATLVISAVLAIAGLRLLNPLLTTLAVGAVSVAFEMAMDSSSFALNQRATMSAGLFCYAVAWIALGIGAIQFRRPSYDAMLSWLVIAMPVAGYLWLAASHDFSAIDYLHNRSFQVLLTPLLPLVFGLAALAVGLRRRTHAPLIAFMACVACLAYELRDLTGMSLEGRLIVWGSLLLVAALALDRWLRVPRDGITSQKMKDGEGALGLLELAGAAVIAPHGQHPPDRGFKGGGGSFGGGGASGEF